MFAQQTNGRVKGQNPSSLHPCTVVLLIGKAVSMYLQLLFSAVLYLCLEKAENTKWRIYRSLCTVHNLGNPWPEQSGLLQSLINVLPTEHNVPPMLTHCVTAYHALNMTRGSKAYTGTLLLSCTKTNTVFWGSLSTVIGPYVSLKKILPPQACWNQCGGSPD